MSHQDRDGRTSSRFHFQALRDALLWLFDTADLSAIAFREDCSWSARGLIFTALLWSWSDESRFSAQSARKRRRAKGAKRRKSASRRDRAEQSRAKKANNPQIWLTIMWHVATGLPWDWRTGPSNSSERDHFRQMTAALPDGALVAGDAGFVGY